MPTTCDGNERSIVSLLQGCNADMSLEERLKACRELLNLVNTQRVRDVDKLPRKTYSFILRSIRLGWEHPEGQLRKDAQASFSGLINIPEFETSVAGDFVDDGFLMTLCGRFQAGVAEECDFLRDTVHWVYASFPNKRPLLRHQIGFVLGYFVMAPSRNYHVAALLQVVRQIVRGFPESLTKVHRSLLTGILLPLHRPNQMAVWSTQQPLIESYHETLVGCLVPFLETEPDLVQVIFESIVEAWPVGFHSNSPKEVLLLHEIGTLIKFISPERCRPVLDVIMGKILGCLQLENSRVVERALFLFKDETFMSMIAENSQIFFLPLLSALLRGGEPFWNPTVTKMTAHVLERLEDVDAGAFSAACESIWGDAVPSVSSVEAEAVPSTSNRVVASRPKAKGDGHLPTTTLKGAMGSWRPPARGDASKSSSKTARNPPAAVTGVAPWAVQAQAAQTSDHTEPSRNGAQCMAPPVQTLKKLRMGTPRDTEAISEKQVSGPPNASGEAKTGPALLEGAQLHEESAGMNHDESGEHVQTQDAAVAKPMPRSDSAEASSSRSTKGAKEGTGLRRVRKFIKKIKRTEVDEPSPGLSWQELQLEPTPTLLPNMRFHDLVFGHELGQGSFSVVKYARQITKGKPRSHWPEFAVKVVSTTKIQELNYEKSVTNEIACLRILSHPGIARLISAFRWRDGAYLVLEYAARGDLHGHIKEHGSISEDSTRFVVGEIVAALCSVHDCGFVYGDLKPENVLITEVGHIKIADFGACRPVTAAAKDILNHSRDALRALRDGDWRVAAGLPPNPMYTLPVRQRDSDSDSDGDSDGNVSGPGSKEGTGQESAKSGEDEDIRAEGTAAYMPPEVARGAAPGFGTDAWALGCVTFLCLAGRPPIFAETDEEIMARVVRFASSNAESGSGDLNDMPTLPPAVSEAPRSLVRALMEPDPQIRLGVEHAAKHEFLASGAVDVFSLHRNLPVELAQGTVAPTPNAAWSRRQNSMIWAPMPQEYRFDAVARELGVIPETAAERGAAFHRTFTAIREPPVPPLEYQ